jgi:hypothetical protein
MFTAAQPERSKEKYMEELKLILKSISEYGAWDIISLLILLTGFIWGLATFWFRRKSLKNFTVCFNWKRVPKNNYPLQLTVEFTNRTQKTAFITGMYFIPDKLRPHPNARIDSSSKRMELKFPTPANVGGRDILLYQKFDSIIENDKSDNTFVCLDPTHSDEEIKKAFHFERAGTLYFYLTLLNREEKPNIYRFKVHAHKNYQLGFWEQFK